MNNIPDEEDDGPEFDTGSNYEPNAAERAAAEKLLNPKLTREQIERRLKSNYNIEPDEAKILFPTDKALEEFYYQLARKAANFGSLEDTAAIDKKKTKSDNYKLSKKEQIALKDMQLLNERAQKATALARKRAKTAREKLKKMEEEARRKLAKAEGQKQPKTAKLQLPAPKPEPKPVPDEDKQREAFEEAGAHLPKKDQVTFEEAQAALAALRETRKKKKG